MSTRNPVSKLERKLLSKVGKAIKDFGMIEDGDRILVALSGGKDSYGLLCLLDRLRERAPIKFELVAWHLDQGQPGYDGSPLVEWLKDWSGEYVIARQDTYSVVIDKLSEDATYCSLCSRLRRGILYNAAAELGCSKIALGHHGDDAVETLLMNMMFTGQLKTMPAWLRSDDGRNTVIRPLIGCYERELSQYAEERAFPILPCNLCGSQDGLQRQAVKALIGRLEEQHPKIRGSMLAALTNVRASHLLDTGLWEQLGLGPETIGAQGTGRGRLQARA
ncbi:MAG: tRNA 2-thiocytidine(32) synthetase TtcA [Rickettsiales bacterium]|nr:tRNA 2-thiocytidine(32) synthetase TtcA [Rickettsiales bacterium]|tara:strand:- start:1569 stop:2399 length:831 start_codon:yes stop_codon:yes gene_type:complete